MDAPLTIASPAGPLQLTHKDVPALFVDARSGATRRFVEFFTANIRNRHTRAAYARSAAQFSHWCGVMRTISLWPS